MTISRIVLAVVGAAGFAAAQNVIMVSVESTSATSMVKVECGARALQQVPLGQILKSVVVTRHDATTRTRAVIVRPESIDSRLVTSRGCEMTSQSTSVPESHGRLSAQTGAAPGAWSGGRIAVRRKGFLNQRGRLKDV